MRILSSLLPGILVVGSLLGFSSCAQKPAPEFDAAELRKATDAQNKLWAEAFVAGDVEKLGSIYLSDATQMPPNEPILKGRDAIKAKMAKDFAGGFKCVDASATTTSVEGWGNTAYETGTYVLHFQIPGAQGVQEDNGKYLIIWKKDTDNTWKYYIETWNSNMPSQGPMAAAPTAMEQKTKKKPL